MLTGALSVERPVEGRTWSDEYIEFWAGVYQANPQVAARGVLFATFLRAPHAILRACAVPGGYAGAKPVRRAALVELAEAAIARLERAGAACSNGRFVEKLRHHAHPRSQRDFIPGGRR